MKFNYVFFLGSHPALSANEALGQLKAGGLAPTLVKITNDYLMIEIATELPATFLKRLGGSTRIGQVIAEGDHLWGADELWQKLFTRDPKKFSVGFGGIGVPLSEIRGLALDLKKVAQEHTSKLRFILPRGRFTLLNAAQVIFNELLKLPNHELVVIKDNATYYLVSTTHVQDIAAYELRDTKRPVRDARVGMLPPKLAQIMINLAVNELPIIRQPGGHAEMAGNLPFTILDPFCGLGTIVQEGWLMGHTMIGSDANRRIVNAALENVSWTMTHFASPPPKPHIRVHDVKEPFPAIWHHLFDAIVTEPFLGRPLHAPLPEKQAHKYLADLADLYYTFFHQALSVLKPRGYILAAFPALRQSWKGPNFSLLPQDFLDAITQLGYIPKQLSQPELADFFPQNGRQSFLYSRPDALTGRELTLWEKR